MDEKKLSDEIDKYAKENNVNWGMARNIIFDKYNMFRFDNLEEKIKISNKREVYKNINTKNGTNI